MSITLIITVYKDSEALAAVLKSVENQSLKDFQVIVAQDAESDDLEEVIRIFSPKMDLLHLQQKDEGFLKNKILNKAIKVSKGSKLVFIDGDCVLHRNFLKQYKNQIKEGRICMGRRVMANSKISRSIRNGQLITPSFFSLLFSNSKHIEEGLYAPWISAKHKPNPHLLGCNMGWHKTDLLHLNGFDEDYKYPGFGEDVDIEMRAMWAGLKKYSMRFKAVQYHLHHERPDREDQIDFSKVIFKVKKEKGQFRCENGLSKLN
ncbi:MAG: glycosyltransferase [Bacteroidetes bacterium]|nr:glycosyltransferase [Bacteroidota bacterium]